MALPVLLSWRYKKKTSSALRSAFARKRKAGGFSLASFLQRGNIAFFFSSLSLSSAFHIIGSLQITVLSACLDKKESESLANQHPCRVCSLSAHWSTAYSTPCGISWFFVLYICFFHVFAGSYELSQYWRRTASIVTKKKTSWIDHRQAQAHTEKKVELESWRPPLTSCSAASRALLQKIR